MSPRPWDDLCGSGSRPGPNNFVWGQRMVAGLRDRETAGLHAASAIERSADRIGELGPDFPDVTPEALNAWRAKMSRSLLGFRDTVLEWVQDARSADDEADGARLAVALSEYADRVEQMGPEALATLRVALRVAQAADEMGTQPEVGE